LAGVSAFSESISRRDAALSSLLKSASGRSGVLAQRNQQITAIMGDGSALFGEIEMRRAVVAELLGNVQGAADQLEGLVHDNRLSLKPALTQIRGVGKLLTKYRGSLDFVLKNIGGFVRSLGEAVGSGPFFQAYVQNLTSPSNLAPVISDVVRGVGASK
jgi:phospholipid/cholesterol/gamma-HCH transport system substrate-binding protein